MKRTAYALAATTLVGCSTLLPVSQTCGSSIILTPRINEGGLKSQATVNVYDASSIDHLTIKLFQGSTEVGAKTLLNVQLTNPIVFTSLKANTSYRIKSFAYLADNTLISHDDATSWLDLTTANDDRPAIAALPVHLIDRLFNGQATSSLGIYPGGYTPVGAEGLDAPKVVTTLAGDGTYGYVDALSASAQFRKPYAVGCDNFGNVYVGDTYNYRIRKISTSGYVTTIAGNGNYPLLDGYGTQAQMSAPVAVVPDALGNVYFIDDGNKRIRKIDSTGNVSTLAGNGATGFADGPGSSACFNFPYGLAVDSLGNVYVGDGINNRIRKIDTSNVVTTFVGDGVGAYRDGTGTQARVSFANRLAMGPNGYLYFADCANYRVRKVNTTTQVVTTVAGDGNQGYLDAVGTQARFYNLMGIAVDAQENVYILDSPRIRKIDKNGIVTTIAGAQSTGFVNGTGTAAKFNEPYSLCADSNGNLYIADRANNCIRKVQ